VLNNYRSLYLLSTLILALVINTLFVINSIATENNNNIYLYPVEDKGKWGYINSKGVTVIDPSYDAAYKFSEGLGLVKIDNRWGKHISLQMVLLI